MRLLRSLLLAAPLLGLAPLGVRASAQAGGDPTVASEVAVIVKNARDPQEQEKRTAAVRRLGQMGGADAAAALVPFLDDPFEHLADHCVSAWIAMLKGGKSAETQAWLAKEGLDAKSVAVRVGAAVALGLTGGSELADAWRAALAREQEPRVLVALARGALAARNGPLVPEAFAPLLAHADGRVVLAAAEVAGGAGEVAEAALRKALQHKDPLGRAGGVVGLAKAGHLTEADVERVLADKAPEPRIALADALDGKGALLPVPGRGEQVLRALLEDASWRVRRAAIDATPRIWQPRVVPALIDRLAAETGRLRDDAIQALQTLTGLDQTDDVELWRRWWSGHGDALDLGPRPEPDRHGRFHRTAPPTPPTRDGAPRETHTSQFFDLVLRSQRLAFVFDLSGSMSRPFAADGGPSKLEVTQKEFARALEGLGERASLDLFVYRYPSTFPPKGTLTRALGKIAPLTPANRKALAEWTVQQPAKGWGAFYEAFDLASQEDVDTLVLLSDGVPSRGRYDRGFRLVDEFVRLNRFRRVAIDTVLIGEKGADREFMESLASATGGRFAAARLPK